jgi:hypothetical protein
MSAHSARTVLMHLSAASSVWPAFLAFLEDDEAALPPALLLGAILLSDKEQRSTAYAMRHTSQEVQHGSHKKPLARLCGVLRFAVQIIGRARITMTMKVPIDREEKFAVRPVPHSREWLEAIRASGERGWQLYRKMGSPKNILAPMVDQSETVSTLFREHVADF